MFGNKTDFHRWWTFLHNVANIPVTCTRNNNRTENEKYIKNESHKITICNFRQRQQQQERQQQHGNKDNNNKDNDSDEKKKSNKQYTSNKHWRQHYE